MNYIYCEEEKFYGDFLDLISYIECGEHYDKKNEQHVKWLKDRIHAVYLLGGAALCVYDNEEPVGFLFYQHDRGLADVDCFGKAAKMIMFGFYERYRGQGLGSEVLERVCQKVKEDGAQVMYTDTYVLNKQAVNFYVNRDFIPVGVHEGENGIDDAGQLYFYKRL